MSQADEPNPGSLYEIRYSEICPWLILVKSLRVALLLRVLLLALVGVLLTEWGWAVLDRTFDTNMAGVDLITDAAEVSPDTGPVLLDPSDPIIEATESQMPALDEYSRHYLAGPMVRGWTWLTGPWLRSTSRNISWSDCLGSVLAGVWAVVVWAIFGGAITRIAALYLTRDEKLGPIKAMTEALTKCFATAGGPLIALVGATAWALPLALTGLAMRLDLGALVIGALWIIALCWGFVLSIVLLGLLLGWPLMWATIGVERSDAFDAVSRCYAYVYQRPLQLAFYLVVASLLGLLGELAVEYFVTAGVALTEWTVSWGAGNERIAQLLNVGSQDLEPLSGTGTTAATLVQFWEERLLAVGASYPMAYLWTAAVGIYLLLRQQIDSTEMDELVLTEPEPTESVPPLTTADNSVPQVRTDESDAES